MRDPVIISWNVTNWITIFLMAALGYAVVGFVGGWWKNKNSSGS
jgi:hypothetical protein